MTCRSSALGEGQSQCCGHSGVGHRELGEVLERGQRHLQIHFRDGWRHGGQKRWKDVRGEGAGWCWGGRQPRLTEARIWGCNGIQVWKVMLGEVHDASQNPETHSHLFKRKVVVGDCLTRIVSWKLRGVSRGRKKKWEVPYILSSPLQSPDWLLCWNMQQWRSPDLGKHLQVVEGVCTRG